MAKKPVLTAAEAAKMIPDGATIMCGGFLACGQARAIVKELVKLGTKDLTLIANDMGRAVGPKGEEFFGIAELIHNHQVKRVIATHVGMTPEVGQQNTEGTLEVNLLPQSPSGWRDWRCGRRCNAPSQLYILALSVQLHS